MTSTEYPHIVTDDRGLPYLVGTRLKLFQIVDEHVRWLLDARQIQVQHPDLSLGTIHSALAYYYDHRQAMGEAAQRYEAETERLLADAHRPPFWDKVRAYKQQLEAEAGVEVEAVTP